MPCHAILFWEKIEKSQKNMPVLRQEYMLFFCLPLSSQPRLRLLRPLSISQHTRRTRQGRGAARGQAYIFDMSSTSGYTGEKYFQEFGPRFLSCPQPVSTWVKNMFRNLISHFLAHTPWRIPPYEKYPRKGVLARGHMQEQVLVIGPSSKF